MKKTGEYNRMKKVIALSAVLTLGLLGAACPADGGNTGNGNKANAPATNKPATNAPATNAPATNAPATNAPAANMPKKDDKPATKDMKDEKPMNKPVNK